jgi:hypothetical protein
MVTLNGKTSKLVKKSLATALSLALAVSSLTVASTDAVAKTKGTVKSVKVTSPTVSGGKLVLKKGQKTQLKYKVTVTKGANKKVTVTSSNKKVVKVIQSGSKYYVKAVGKKGEAKITVASKADSKKKAVLKVAVGSRIKKITSAAITETKTVQDTTYLNSLKKEGKLSLAEATKKAQTITKTKKKASSKALVIYTSYTDKTDSDHEKSIFYTYKLSITTNPTKPAYKGMSWKSSKTSLVTVDANSNIIVRATKDLTKEKDYTLGTCTLTGTTKDGSNKKVKVKIKVVAKANQEPPKVYEEESRTATVVEDFESYPEGYNWETDTQKNATNGKATKGKEYVDSNCGSMTVVTDPEDPNNKVLKIDYYGDTQAYDYAPIFNLKLKKVLGEYSAIQVQSRVVGTSADVRYKTVGAYFAKYGKITPEYYFYTSLSDADAVAKGIDTELVKFKSDVSMATGADKKYNVKAGETNAGLVYNNKTFPMYYDNWATSKIDINRTTGYKESESDSITAGWHQNTLDFNTGVINTADSTLLSQKNISVVLGSTYTGKYEKGAGVTLYLDNVAVLDGAIALDSFEVTPTTNEITKGYFMSINSTDEITYTPDNSTQKELVWTSSNESVATVNTDKSNPRIYGVGAGTATITATCKANPELTRSFDVTVVEGTTATSDLSVDLSKIVPVKDENDTTTKVYSTITGTYANGALSLPFTQADKDSVVIDLGGPVDLTQYSSVSIVGTSSTQLSFEIYPDGSDFNEDLYYRKQVDYATYPFFTGSREFRASEGGGYGNIAEENCWFNFIEDADETHVHGSLRKARYILLKANKFDADNKEAVYSIKSITFKTERFDKTTLPTEADLEAKGYVKA